MSVFLTVAGIAAGSIVVSLGIVRLLPRPKAPPLGVIPIDHLVYDLDTRRVEQQRRTVPPAGAALPVLTDELLRERRADGLVHRYGLLHAIEVVEDIIARTERRHGNDVQARKWIDDDRALLAVLRARADARVTA